MLGNAAVYVTSRTQHCVTLSMTEAEYVALAEGVKEGMFVTSVMSFMQPNVYKITFDRGQRGGPRQWRRTPLARAEVSTSM